MRVNPPFPGAVRPVRSMVVVLSLLAVLLGALVAGCGGSDLSGSAPGGSAMSAPEMAQSVGESRGDAFSGEAPADADGGAAVVAAGERRLVFTGDMTLRVADVVKAMAAARAWAAAHDGFVENDNSSGTGSELYGNMTLRVPQAHYEATREHLRSLATSVDSDASQRQDVTAQHADLQARLENLQATEQELQALLTQVREQGGSAEDILAVYRQLTEIRGQVESLQAQLDTLREQVALSTLRVSFVPPPTSASDVSESWAPGAVFRQAMADLVGALQGLANMAIYLIVTAPVWLMLVGLAALAVWLVRRLRRRLSRRPDVAPSVPGLPGGPPAGAAPGS